MLRTIRITLAAVFFLGITLLFLDVTGSLHHWLSWMAKVQFLPAVMALNVAVVLALVVLTLLFGRIYCSVVCPLGVMQDLFGWLGKKSSKNRYSYSPEVRWLRYAMLAVMVVAIAVGAGAVVQLLAPYSAFGRIATMLLQPLWAMGNNALATLAERYDSYAFYTVDVWLRSMPALIVAAATLAVLAVLAWRGGRTYCNTVCPVGTVLAVAARFSLFKVRFDAGKCKSCSLCTKNCKASCIDYKTHRVDYSRCVACGDCISKCKFGALKYSSHTTSPSREGEASGDASRRSFLVSAAMLATAALAQEKKKVDGGLAELAGKKAPERQTPLVPPGAQSLKNMLTRCTGCQLCVSECPNHVLRPSLLSIDSLFTPTMAFERGYCRPECTRCGEVCPAGAITPVGHEEKAAIQTGHAVVSAEHCLSATGEAECGNCARHCPAQAIEMVPSDPQDDLSPAVPAVNEERCIGCGACEYLCPVRPLSAIHVEGHEVHRYI